VQALLLTHCNGKVIEASVRGPVSKVDTVDCPQHQEEREPVFGEIRSRWEAENTYSIFCDECLGPETANGCSGSASARATAENYVRGVDTGELGSGSCIRFVPGPFRANLWDTVVAMCWLWDSRAKSISYNKRTMDRANGAFLAVVALPRIK
jgi:hypothetical protein